MHTIRVLHLSQTDIRYDSRILKELKSIAKMADYNACGIGIASDKVINNFEHEQNFTLITLHLISDVLKIFPRPIRYALTMTEMTVRFLLKSINQRPNIIHCHDTMALPAGVLVKLITGSKLVYDAHELESNKNAQTKILSRATLFIEKKCWPYVDHFISVSDSIIEWYNINIGFKNNTLILNSPIIQISELKRSKYFHQLYGIETTKLVFIYLGILGTGRGIELILDTFCDGNIESHVVFVGYGELEGKIRDISKLQSNIHLHKAVPHEEVVTLAKSADVGLCLIENVSLSDYYSLPNKLFEYAFAGLPILTSDFPDISKLVNKYNLGLVCTLNLSSVANTIKKIETKPLGRLNSDITELGWQYQAEKLINAYSILLSN